ENLQDKLTKQDSIVILSETGHNAGDGILLARYLKENNHNVILPFPLGKPTSEAARHDVAFYEQQGVELSMFDYYVTYDVIIDSLIGVSLNRKLNKQLAELLSRSNRSNAYRIAIDLTTGVRANDGEVDEVFKAHVTLCLDGVKESAYLVDTAHYFGEVEVIEIGVKQTSTKKVIKENEVVQSLPKRPASGHKGTFGTSLLIAGSMYMPGSAALSSIGAIRTGTRRLTVATEASVISTVATHVPEATFTSMSSSLNLLAYDALAIGPGLTESDQAGKFIKESLASN